MSVIPARIFDCPVKINFLKSGSDSVSGFSKVDTELLGFLPDKANILFQLET